MNYWVIGAIALACVWLIALVSAWGLLLFYVLRGLVDDWKDKQH